MKTLKIKTYKSNSTHDSNQFFILSKGNHAGRPMEKPCPNCFIVTADNEQHKDQLYWICYSIWKSDAYFPLLCGSVIPFLHINDVATAIERAIQKVKVNPERFDEAVSLLQKVMRTEKLLELQLKLTSEIKGSISRKLWK